MAPRDASSQATNPPSVSVSDANATPTSDPAPEKYHGTPPVLHNAAVVVAIVGPIGLLLPGRTRGSFSLQNLVLGSGSFWALNQLATDYTGKSIVARSNERWRRVFDAVGTGHGAEALPTERAREIKALMEAERVRREAGLGEEERRRREEKRRERERNERGVMARLWYGKEKDGWQEKRLEEEKKALESGKGYGDLIVEQIKEVWEGRGRDENGAREKSDGNEGKK